MSFKVKQYGKTNCHVPIEVIPFVEGLERIVGIENLHFGELSRQGSSVREIKQVGYDEAAKMFILEIKTSNYVQPIRVNIEPASTQAKEVYDFVKGYKF